MTREEATKVLEMFLHKQCDLARTKFAYDQNTILEAVNMASKLLEQEPIIDKIRAEIKALSPEPTVEDVIDGNPIKDAIWETLSDVLKIIDKYKVESEDKE